MVLPPSRPRRSSAHHRVLIAAAALVALSSCAPATDSAETPEAGDGRASSAANPSRTGTPTAASPSAQTSTGAADPAPTTSSPVRPPVGRRASSTYPLLAADRMPSLSPASSWRERATGPGPVCHPFALDAIGAQHSGVRGYVDRGAPPESTPARASHRVAVMPDRRTTRRVLAVLDSWHAGCAARLAEHNHAVRVSPRVEVQGLGASAWHHRTVVRPDRTSPRIVEHAGYIVSGRTVAVVVLRHEQGAYGAAAREDDIVGLLRQAADGLV